MSVALNISYSLLSTAELWDGILKTTEYLCMMGVFDSMELRMLRRAGYVSALSPVFHPILCGLRFMAVMWTCECMRSLYTLSHSLFSLVFATRWNQKHPSYVSIWLFLKFHVRVFLMIAVMFVCIKILAIWLVSELICFSKVENVSNFFSPRLLLSNWYYCIIIGISAVANYYILSDISVSDIRLQIWNSWPRILYPAEGLSLDLKTSP